MIRFEFLEKFGLIAAMSGEAEGDCARNAEAPAARDTFLAHLGLMPTHLCVPSQVHGRQVSGFTSEGNVVADAVVCIAAGQVAGVTVADCVPLLLYLESPRAVAAVHAGREGTFQNIAAASVEALLALGGRVAEIHAVIGPSAGPCCYEVSLDILKAWTAQELPVRGRHLDLWRANRQQLIAAGVPATHIHQEEICTICMGGFHSLRKTGTKSRNLAVVSLV